MKVNNKTNSCFKQAIILFLSVYRYKTLLVSIFCRAKETEDREDNFIQEEVSSSLDSVGFRESIIDEEVFLVFCKVIQGR